MAKNSSPLVSIVLTSYNYERYISEAINSVINQNFHNWELIIVDDGSNDNSLSIIKEYQKIDEKIKFYTHPNNQNLGLKASLELGISNCSGKYLAFLESDDYWDLTNLKKRVEILEKYKDVVLVYSDLNLIFEYNFDLFEKYSDYLNYSRFIGKKFKNSPKDIIDFVMYVNPVVSFSNIMGRTDLIKKCNFTSTFELWNDWWLVAFLSLYGKFYYIPERLLNWRIHSNSANYKLMSEVNTTQQGKLFKKELLNYIGDILLKENRKKDFEKIKRTYFSKVGYTKFFLHSIDFFIHYPISVLRTFLMRR